MIVGKVSANRPPRWIVVLGIMLTTTLLGGCATAPPPKPAAPSAHDQEAWQRHQAKVRQITNWNCVGRAAVRAGHQGGTVNVSWQQLGSIFHVRLTAPLDQGTVEMTGDAHRMLITDSQGHRTLTTQPQKALARMTGWQLPIGALPDWIRGLTHTDDATYSLDSHGRLQTLSDGGWKIAFNRYQNVASRVFLPAKLELVKDDLRVRLLIRHWDLSPDQTATPQP